jgi:hypothetical protein
MKRQMSMSDFLLNKNKKSINVDYSKPREWRESSLPFTDVKAQA